jgi:hypothetical protein
MIVTNCPSCQRVTGHKRALGWGTFFAVVLTGGLWLLALPLYKARCVICGTLPTEAGPRVVSEEARVAGARYSAGVTLVVMGALFVGIILLVWLVPK